MDDMNQGMEEAHSKAQIGTKMAPEPQNTTSREECCPDLKPDATFNSAKQTVLSELTGEGDAGLSETETAVSSQSNSEIDGLKLPTISRPHTDLVKFIKRQSSECDVSEDSQLSHIGSMEGDGLYNGGDERALSTEIKIVRLAQKIVEQVVPIAVRAVKGDKLDSIKRHCSESEPNGTETEDALVRSGVIVDPIDCCDDRITRCPNNQTAPLVSTEISDADVYESNGSANCLCPSSARLTMASLHFSGTAANEKAVTSKQLKLGEEKTELPSDFDVRLTCPNSKSYYAYVANADGTLNSASLSADQEASQGADSKSDCNVSLANCHTLLSIQHLDECDLGNNSEMHSDQGVKRLREDNSQTEEVDDGLDLEKFLMDEAGRAYFNEENLTINTPPREKAKENDEEKRKTDTLSPDQKPHGPVLAEEKKSEQKSSVIRAGWAKAAAFIPTAEPRPRNKRRNEGAYANNNNCYSKFNGSSSKPFDDNSMTTDASYHSGEDDSQHDILDIIVLPDQPPKLSQVSRLTTQPSVHPPVQCQPRVTRILHAPSNPPPVHSTKPPYHYHQTRSLPPRHQTPLKQLAPRLQPTSGSVWYYHQYPAAPPPPADCYGTMPPAAYVPGYPHLSLLEPIPEMAYQEINGCYYFPPTSERAMSAAAQYGYPQRGKQRKAQRLSSRFATQAGKFHHHANFYVKSSAESVVTHQMGDN